MTLLWLKPKGVRAIGKPFKNALLICLIGAFKVNVQSLNYSVVGLICCFFYPTSRIPPVNTKFIPHFLVQEMSSFCWDIFNLYPVFRIAHPAWITLSLCFDTPESSNAKCIFRAWRIMIISVSLSKASSVVVSRALANFPSFGFYLNQLE